MSSDQPRLSESDGSPQRRGGFSWMKKTVLLVDVDPHTRDSRAKMMRMLGVTVHCASSARAARSKLESRAYNLVLVDLGRDNEDAESLAREIRLKNPRQLVAFLVGSPLFVATSLNGKDTRPAQAMPYRPTALAQKAALAESSFDFGQKIKDAEGKEVA
jgi:CheY-like chemotaxis protein